MYNNPLFHEIFVIAVPVAFFVHEQFCEGRSVRCNA